MIVQVEELEDRDVAPGAMSMCVLGAGDSHGRPAGWSVHFCVLSNLAGLLRKQLCRTVFFLAFVSGDIGHSRGQKHLFVPRASPAALGTALRQGPQARSILLSPAQTFLCAQGDTARLSVLSLQ